MRDFMTAALIALAVVCGPAEARRPPAATWSVTPTSDPITGVTSCTVAALDRVGRMRFTRMGAIYPVVEINSQLGLLVGVSSGGQFRLPTGTILWRVDDRPFRTLRAEDNPYPGSAATSGTALESAAAYANRLAATMTATSTMASGGRAREMLDERLAGQLLIYRQENAAASYGLADGRNSNVGQITRDGLVPYPLDGSFREGLATCGIATSALSE